MSAITLFEDTTSVVAQANQLKDMALHGEVDPLTAYVNISRVGEVIKKLKEDDQFVGAAMKEFSKYGEKTTQVGACQVQEAEVGVKYDFSVCGCPMLNDLYSQQESIKERIKERETHLKFLQSKTTVLDENTGEIIELMPPIKTSKTTLKLTFKKY